ncbi:hypothetical protein NPIL_429801, partial [Nephila pilipes]
ENWIRNDSNFTGAQEFSVLLDPSTTLLHIICDLKAPFIAIKINKTQK